MKSAVVGYMGSVASMVTVVEPDSFRLAAEEQSLVEAAVVDIFAESARCTGTAVGCNTA